MLEEFKALRQNLVAMAEMALEQTILQADALEHDNQELAAMLIVRDSELDLMEKESDILSRNSILEVVEDSERVRPEPEAGDDDSIDFQDGEEMFNGADPLSFALSAIRLTRDFEGIGDQVVNTMKAFRSGRIRSGLFCREELPSLILARAVTLVGMAVESFVEGKERFYGSVQTVARELDEHCADFMARSLEDMRFSRPEFADLYRIIISLERQGDLAVNIAMELVRLQTGRDVRHLFPGAPGFHR